MIVSLAQINIEWENKIENFDKALKFVNIAKNEKADIILFPEMSFTGFSMNTSLTKESKEETIRLIKKFSADNHIAIGFGWVKDRGKKCENHYTVTDKNGDIISDYIKIHSFSYEGEDKFFSSGSKLTLFSINDFRFSSVLCYDLRFSEMFVKLSEYADAIIIAANWPSVREEHWQNLLKARAIENQVYILAINCTGIMNNRQYCGRSMVINPNGEVLSSVGTEEKLLTLNITNDVNDYRQKFPVLQDRNVIFGF